MVTFQRESLEEVKGEVKGLLGLHWKEVALNKELIPLEPQWDTYALLEKAGNLHILTARDQGLLVGYYVSIIKEHLHYASSKTAFSDIYYLHPSYRKGRSALRLFTEHEKAMEKLGVQRIVTMCKVHLDISPLLEKLGHNHTEKVFTKIIKGAK